MKIKTMILSVLSLFIIAATGFADNLILENQTTYPSENQKVKIAVQWATSAKEVEEGNKAITYSQPLKALETLKESGKVSLNIPEKAEYLRVLVWSKGEGEPDLLTNWVEIIPNKSYTLKPDHLVPAILMLGTGC